MNKFSFYNYFYADGNKHYLYNFATDVCLAIVPEITSLINENVETIDRLKDLHPTLHNTLLQNGFIVDKETDEVEAVINAWKMKESSSESYSITVLPTLNCNCNCWYCYEQHSPKSNMSQQMVESIKKHMDLKISSDTLKHFHLSFFGGEPLLCFNNTVYPLVTYAKEKCNINNVKLSIHFTTNGVLLTDKRIKMLTDLSVPLSFQITLDGNRETHDNIRCTKNKKPTFDKIISNIHKLIENDVFVNLRVNYTNANIDTSNDIINDFKGLTQKQSNNLVIDFQQVWQNYSTNDANSQKRLNLIIDNFKHQNLNISPRLIQKTNCYADYENNLVINYNGDIFKCTARDFISGNREGILCKDGTIVYNDNFEKRMKIKHSNEMCKNCNIYPICCGPCSQNDLENEHRNNCAYMYSDEDKNNVILTKLRALIKNNEKTIC